MFITYLSHFGHKSIFEVMTKSMENIEKALYSDLSKDGNASSFGNSDTIKNL